jgi:hypothetical protein
VGGAVERPRSLGDVVKKPRLVGVRPCWWVRQGSRKNKTGGRNSRETLVVGRCSKETQVGGRAVHALGTPSCWARQGSRKTQARGRSSRKTQVVRRCSKETHVGGRARERWAGRGLSETQLGRRSSVETRETYRLIGSAVEDKVGGRGGTVERPGWWAGQRPVSWA